MKGFKVIILLIVAVLVYSVLNRESSTQPPQQGKTEQPQPDIYQKILQQGAYALRAADNSWPAMEESQSIVSGDLTQKNYYLVFDGSGSMNEDQCSNGKSKVEVAKKSVNTFINKIPGDANIGLLIFDDSGIAEASSLGSSSKENIIQQVSAITAGGGTPLMTSMKYATAALLKQARTQLGYGEYHLVVITDGEASEGEDPSEIVFFLNKTSPIVIHTIGFCINGEHSLNREGSTIYKSANNPLELAEGLDSVLAEASGFTVDSFERQAQ